MTTDDEEASSYLSFLTLRAATLNVIAYLNLNKLRDERRYEQEEPRHKQREKNQKSPGYSFAQPPGASVDTPPIAPRIGGVGHLLRLP